MPAALAPELELPGARRVEQHHRLDPEAAVLGAAEAQHVDPRLPGQLRRACSRAPPPRWRSAPRPCAPAAPRARAMRRERRHLRPGHRPSPPRWRWSATAPPSARCARPPRAVAPSARSRLAGDRSARARRRAASASRRRCRTPARRTRPPRHARRGGSRPSPTAGRGRRATARSPPSRSPPGRPPPPAPRRSRGSAPSPAPSPRRRRRRRHGRRSPRATASMISGRAGAGVVGGEPHQMSSSITKSSQSSSATSYSATIRPRSDTPGPVHALGIAGDQRMPGLEVAPLVHQPVGAGPRHPGEHALEVVAVEHHAARAPAAGAADSCRSGRCRGRAAGRRRWYRRPRRSSSSSSLIRQHLAQPSQSASHSARVSSSSG